MTTGCRNSPRRTARRSTAPSTWVHWLMACCSSAGALLRLRALALPPRAQPGGRRYTGVRSHASTWLEGAVAVVEAILLIGFSIPLWADRVERLPAARRTRSWCAWSASSSPGTSTIPVRTASSARTDDRARSTCRANPLGLDREDPAAKDDVTTVNQLHLPVGQAGDRPPQQQGRDPQLRRCPRCASSRTPSRASMIPVWFVPTVTTEEMRAASSATPSSSTRSPAPSSAASATTACAAS